MKENEVILNYKIDKIYSETSRRKVIDAKIYIQPHPHFVNDIIKVQQEC
jgi:hypothetical protein